MDVLFLASMSRSGSTITDMLLGEQPGIRSCGELRFLWEHGLRDNNFCTCGECFYDCPFWDVVGRRAFDGWQNVDHERHIALKREVERHRYMPYLLAPSGTFKFRLDAMLADLEPIYKAIADTSGARVIVDSSKDPPYLYILRHLGLDVGLLHMVRDPRGVAYSWKKAIPRNDGSNKNMHTQAVGESALHWVDYNVLFHLAETLGMPRHFLRYEDFVRDPGRHLAEIVRFTGGDEVNMAALEDEDFSVGERHMIGGNPHRFQQGPRRLRVDEKWKTAMPRKERIRATVLTLPLLKQYGYPVKV